MWKVSVLHGMRIALSDGAQLYAVRYASEGIPPSLFYRRNEADDGWLVVSEPLHDGPDWHCVSASSFCTFSYKTVTQTRFAPSNDAYEQAAQLV